MKNTFIRNSLGMMEKDKMYGRYVEFCENEGITPKEKQIFSKLVFSLYPEVRSTRLGPIGKQSHYYLGLSWRDEVDQNDPSAFATVDSKKRKRSPKVEEDSEDDEEEVEIKGDHSDEDSDRRNKKRRTTPRRRRFAPKKEEDEQDEEEEPLTHASSRSCSRGSASPIMTPSCEGSLVHDYTVVPRVVPVCMPEDLEADLMSLYGMSMQQEGLADLPTFKRYVNLFVYGFLSRQAYRWQPHTVVCCPAHSECLAMRLCCTIFCGASVEGAIDVANEALRMCTLLSQSMKGAQIECRNYRISLGYLSSAVRETVALPFALQQVATELHSALACQ